MTGGDAPVPTVGGARADGRAPLFAFGTLMDPDVLALVCDTAPGHHATEPAHASDSARRSVVGDDYPVLVAAPGERLEGVLVHGLDAEAFERVSFFEGEEFVLAPIVVHRADGEPVEACYFADAGTHEVADLPWDLAGWQAGTKAASLPRMRRYMDCYGRMSVAEADAYW